jgi:hypothetical protein
MEDNMTNAIAITAFMTLLSMSTPTLVWGAESLADTEQAKRQVAVIPALQEAAAFATGHPKAGIEAKSSAHQLTIAVLNSKLNDGPPTERTTEASKIAAACVDVIAGKPDFAAVVIIHVDYVKRTGSKSTLVEGFDFNKAPDGSFKLHLT